LELRKLNIEKTQQGLKTKVNRMERSSKRGKIPQQDWPSIIKRYEAGETLASIAGTYGCSPPAISYVVNRSRAREPIGGGIAQNASETLEPGLAKGHAGEMPVSEAAPQIVESLASMPVEASRFEPQQAEGRRASNEATAASDGRHVAVSHTRDQAGGHDRAQDPTDPQIDSNASNSTLGRSGTVSQNGESRRTLRVALSPDGGLRSEQQHEKRGDGDAAQAAARQPAGGQERALLVQPRGQHSGHYASANNFRTPTAEPHKAKEGDAFIDQALRKRVDEDIAVFLAAFDAALAHDSLENRTGLRQATDRLLRAGARTRIELERLEARVPLPVRDNDGRTTPSWRPR
jgi:hypothetical protein